MATLDIVIVHWNSGGHLARCLESIAVARAEVELRRVVVVDNASTDGSLAAALATPAAGSLPLVVERNATNVGFGRACNQGVGADPAEVLLFLNPDAAPGVDSLAAALGFLELDADGRIAVLGPQLTDEEGRVLPTCSRFPTPARLLWQASGLSLVLPRFFHGMRMREWDHRSTRCVDQVMGACFFVRGEAWQRLGGFDERFFLYFEEVDFCLRAARAGQDVVYLVDPREGETRVIHAGGGSSARVPAQRLLYSWRSRIQYARKHFDTAGTLVVVLSLVCCEFPLRVLRAASQLSWSGVQDVWHAFRTLLVGLPDLLRDRPRKRVGA